MATISKNWLERHPQRNRSHEDVVVEISVASLVPAARQQGAAVTVYLLDATESKEKELQLDESEIRLIMSGMGVESTPSEVQALKYVGGLSDSEKLEFIRKLTSVK